MNEEKCKDCPNKANCAEIIDSSIKEAQEALLKEMAEDMID